MTVTLPRLAVGMNSAHDPRVLQTLGLQGIALAVWLREAEPSYQAWLDGLPAARLPRFTRTLPAIRCAEIVRQACLRAGTPGGAEPERLAEDVAEIVIAAAEALGSPVVDVALEVVEERSCPKWHLDAVRARVIATLRGPGTEFGPARPDGKPSEIHTLPVGAVGAFRGILWPGAELSGIVHRSPDVRPNSPRLVLRVDPVDTQGAC